MTSSGASKLARCTVQAQRPTSSADSLAYLFVVTAPKGPQEMAVSIGDLHRFSVRVELQVLQIFLSCPTGPILQIDGWTLSHICLTVSATCEFLKARLFQK